MISLNKIFGRYAGWLRSLKVVYVINNILNANHLRHNKKLYPRFGLKKSIYAPIGSQDFKAESEDIPWLDKPNASARLLAHKKFGVLPHDLRAQLFQFVEEGYMILKGFFDEAAVEKLNEEINHFLQSKKVGFNYTRRKIMESYKVSTTANQFFRDERLLELLNFTMGKKVIPFHTINFIEGSEQAAHSDFIHMTTEPKGYLIAAWIALENCDAGNGPLFFYPRSHRLPYVLSADYPSGNTRWTIGAHSNRRYEEKIAELVEEKGLQKKYFMAKKGDVLIWHANLIHGGEAIRTKGATRKSMVAHYFCEGVICYHEISQRPALLQTDV